jgi:hypothetical protein
VTETLCTQTAAANTSWRPAGSIPKMDPFLMIEKFVLEEPLRSLMWPRTLGLRETLFSSWAVLATLDVLVGVSRKST